MIYISDFLHILLSRSRRNRVLVVLGFLLFSLHISASDSISFQGLKGAILVDALNKAAVSVRNVDLQASYDYSIRAKEEAILCDHQNGLGIATKNIGIVYYFAGENIVADSCYQEAIICFEKSGNDVEIARCRHNIGLIQIDRGDLDGAISTYLKLEDYYRLIEDDKALGESLMNHANALYWKSDYTAAAELLMTAYSLAAKVDDSTQMMNVMLNIGAIYLEIERPNKALSFFEGAYQLASLTNNIYLQATVLSNMSDVYFLRKNYVKAEELILQSLRLKEEVGNVVGIPATLRRLGVLQFSRKQYSEALTSFSKALKLDQDVGDTIRCAITYRWMANVLTEQNEFQQAMNYLNMSLDIAKQFSVPAEERNTLREQAILALKIGDVNLSYEYFDKFMFLKDSIEQTVGGLSSIDENYIKEGNIDDEINLLLEAYNSRLQNDFSFLKIALIVSVFIIVILLLWVVVLVRKRAIIENEGSGADS